MFLQKQLQLQTEVYPHPQHHQHPHLLLPLPHHQCKPRRGLLTSAVFYKDSVTYQIQVLLNTDAVNNFRATNGRTVRDVILQTVRDVSLQSVRDVSLQTVRDVSLQMQ